MSTKSYCCYGYGVCVVDPDEIISLAQENGITNVYDLPDKIGGYLVSSESADDICCDYGPKHDEVEETKCGLFVETAFAPSIIERAYESLDDIEKEFREYIKFPEGFDVKNHLGYFHFVLTQ